MPAGYSDLDELKSVLPPAAKMVKLQSRDIATLYDPNLIKIER